MSTSSLVILAASTFEISCGKADRQTDKHMNAAEQSTHAISIGIGRDQNQYIHTIVRPNWPHWCRRTVGWLEACRRWTAGVAGRRLSAAVSTCTAEQRRPPHHQSGQFPSCLPYPSLPCRCQRPASCGRTAALQPQCQRNSTPVFTCATLG